MMHLYAHNRIRPRIEVRAAIEYSRTYVRFGDLPAASGESLFHQEAQESADTARSRYRRARENALQLNDH